MIKKNLFILDLTPSEYDHNDKGDHIKVELIILFLNHSLEPGQVNTIFENLPMGVLENYEGYTTSHCLEIV